MNIYKKKKSDNNLKNFYLKREKNNSIVFKDYVLYLTSYEYGLITKNVEVWTGSNTEVIEVISEMIYSNNVDGVSEYVKTIKMMSKFL
ncbi:MAG: hypothetical protein Q7T77_07070 [Sulfuricurvum sp.]|nr:hypothetical protein [Sulfuricurvum sp.]